MVFKIFVGEDCYRVQGGSSERMQVSIMSGVTASVSCGVKK